MPEKELRHNKYLETLINNLSCRGIEFDDNEWSCIEKARTEFDYYEERSVRLDKVENLLGWYKESVKLLDDGPYEEIIAKLEAELND